MASLTVEPLIPSSLWVAIAAAAGVVLCVYGMRRPPVVSRGRWAGIVALMSLAMLLVLGVLLNPMWVEELPPPAGKPLLTVLLDDSASMATPDAGQGKSRYQGAVDLAKRLDESLSRQFDLRVCRFSESPAPIGAGELAARKAEGKCTDIAAAVASCLAEDRSAGQAVALLSDGIHNAPGGLRAVLDSVQSARGSAMPIYTATFGGEVEGIDLGVALRSPQDLAFVGQKAPVVAVVSHRGIKAGRADVSLLYDGKEVDRQQADLSAAGPAIVRFQVGQEKVGVYCYEVRVEPLPGEITTANNAASYLLRVVDKPVRVLMLEGKPYWDSKFLVRTLSQLPALEVESVVRVAEGRLIRRSMEREAATQPATAPSTQPAGRQGSWQVLAGAGGVLEKPGALKGYQVLVLGRDAEPFLTPAALANLQAWISRDGGSLVCYRGAPAAMAGERLGKLLPVKWSPSRETRFRMRLTDQGRDLHWLGADEDGGESVLAGLPTLASTAQLDKSKALAVVLAAAVSPDGQEHAAVVAQPYGTGRVVVIEGAGMWRWAFLPPQSQELEEAYASLWQSLLRWLVSGVGLLPGQNMALRSDNASFGPTDSATATLLLREELAKGQLPAVELYTGGKQVGAFAPAAAGDAPGTYRVDFGRLAEGRYEARVAGAGASDAAARTAFDVRAVGQEQLDLRARPELMARIAADSGGAVIGGEGPDQVMRHFKEHLARLHPPRVRRTSAWDRWWVLGAVLAAWGCCWMVRRRGGLV